MSVQTAGQQDVRALGDDHMLAMLSRHYQPENRPLAGVFAPEIGSPCGKRRADLIWMPTTIAGGKGLHGHEIKVSRNDLLVELDDPTKADPWSQYCVRWWLVVSRPDMVAGLDIPAAWGVMAPPSGRRTRTMTVLKPAPALTPRNPAPGIARLAAWQLHRTSGRVAQLEADNRSLKRREADLTAEVAQLRAHGHRRDHPEAQRVARILALLDARVRDERIWVPPEVPDEVVVEALLDHTATRNAADYVRTELRRLISDVKHLTQPFGQHALASLGEAEAMARRLTTRPVEMARTDDDN